MIEIQKMEDMLTLTWKAFGSRPHRLAGERTRQPYSGTTLRVEANLYLADRPSVRRHEDSIVLPLCRVVNLIEPQPI